MDCFSHAPRHRAVHTVVTIAVAAAAIAATALAAACGDAVTVARSMEPTKLAAGRALAPLGAAAAGTTEAPRIYCVVEIAPRALSCSDLPITAGGPTGTAAIATGRDGSLLLGGQGQNVTFATPTVNYTEGVVWFEATVTNHIAQRLAGATNDGVRLSFVTAPSVTIGTGTVTLLPPKRAPLLTDATSSPDGRPLPAISFGSSLATGQQSVPVRLHFAAPASVKAFSFGIYVTGTAPRPNGWVGIAPVGVPPHDTLTNVAATVGQSQQLLGTVVDAAGRVVAGQQVAFTSAAPSIASITSAGVVTGVAAGTATITAASGTRAGAITVTVAAGTATPPPPATPPVVPPGALTFAITPSQTFAISRFIYGANFTTDANAWGGTTPPTELTFNRIGGNRLSAYNWETNWSNAGNDYNYQNDSYLSASRTPGEAVRQRAVPTFANGAGLLVTVPMLGYVAGNANGVRLDTTSATRAARLAAHFKTSRAFKGTALSLTPDVTDGSVSQDEFVNWVEKTFPAARTDAQRPIFYSLDNEPDLWHGTHQEVQSTLQTYDGFINTTIQHARAVKSIAPTAAVFGPATATWAGMATLGRYPSADPTYGTQFFLDVYLDRLRQAETTYGRRLVDVLDIHWYPEVGTNAGTITNEWATQSPAMINARLQAPRSLWDPTYNENTWVTSAANGPIRLLPRLRQTIAARYPGTKLAITEYNYGRGGDISGGIAQADVLGIFGREGLFAATFWPLADPWAPGYGGSGAKAYAYTFGAFRMFLNFDGQGGKFGATGVQATTSDAVNSSVYASTDAAGRLIVVAINKTTAAKAAAIQVAGGSALRVAKAYALTAASPTPQSVGTLPVSGGTVVYTMPAMSVSTLVVTP